MVSESLRYRIIVTESVPITMHDWDISYDQTLEGFCSKNYKKFLLYSRSKGPKFLQSRCFGLSVRGQLVPYNVI